MSAGRPVLRDHVDRDAAAAVAHRDRVVRVDRHLDRVVAARESLVDRVRDDLFDEVVEAPGAGRADVHSGAQTDRLEALEHGDVLGRVVGRHGRLRHREENPCKTTVLPGADSVSETGVDARPGERKTSAFCTDSRSVSSPTEAASAAARCASSAVGRDGRRRGARAAGRGAAPERSGARRHRAFRRSPLPVVPSSNAHTESAVFT